MTPYQGTGHRLRVEATTMRTISIGQLAKAAGVGVETVRFCERKGLLDVPARKDSGY